MSQMDSCTMVDTKEKAWTCKVCKFCKRDFATKNNLNSHIDKCSGKMLPYLCELCGKIILSRSGLLNHLTNHAQKKTNFCKVCAKQFTNSIYLKIHMNAHHNEKPFECQVCAKRFKLKQYLYNHTQRCHFKTNKSYQCQQCEHSFKTKSELTSHINLVHEKSLKVKCQICSKEFSTRGSLDNHNKTTHSDNRPFKCQTCSLAFKTIKDLRIHEQIHSNGDRVHCNLCGSIVKKVNLKNHLKCHQKQPIYKCKLCERSFEKFLDFRQHELHKHGKQFAFCFTASKSQIAEDKPDSAPKPMDQSAFMPTNAEASSSSRHQNISNSK